MPPPSNIKQVQSINGCLTSLRRFISKLAEISLPFFQALKESVKVKGIIWNLACQEAFDSLKQYLSTPTPPVLSRHVFGEPLYLYLVVASKAVSFYLLRKEDDKQFPIYYVSHVLRDAEVRHPTIEKMAY